MACRFKFDDERVTKEDIKRALEEQYGGEEEVRFSSILVSFIYFQFIHIIFDLFLSNS